MTPDLKFETKEELVNGEKILRYFINKKEVDSKTYNTLKPDYDKPLPHSSKEFPKLDINNEDDYDDTEEDCMCPVCQSRFDILDLITIFGEEKLDFEYLYESLGDILDELYDIAFNDGQVNGLQNIANISVDIAEAIMTGKLEDGLIDVDDIDDIDDIDGIDGMNDIN